VLELQASGACYSWRLPPPRRLDGVISIEACKEACAVLWRRLCGGVVLALREPQRATLVERDAKGDKWHDRVKVLDLVVSTPRGRV
jgi:hypothetical protein